jgi:hypothetical protein
VIIFSQYLIVATFLKSQSQISRLRGLSRDKTNNNHSRTKHHQPQLIATSLLSTPLKASTLVVPLPSCHRARPHTAPTPRPTRVPTHPVLRHLQPVRQDICIHMTKRHKTDCIIASSTASSNFYAQSGYSTSRNKGYGNKPPVIINGGGQIKDPNTSTSAPNSGYYN